MRLRGLSLGKQYGISVGYASFVFSQQEAMYPIVVPLGKEVVLLLRGYDPAKDLQILLCSVVTMSSH